MKFTKSGPLCVIEFGAHDPTLCCIQVGDKDGGPRFRHAEQLANGARLVTVRDLRGRIVRLELLGEEDEEIPQRHGRGEGGAGAGA